MLLIITLCKQQLPILKINPKEARFLAHTALLAFGTYFCMYAFRKPFTVATYEHVVFFGIDYKILLIIAQMIGYMASKFIGIKLISELKNEHRLPYLLAMIGGAELCLVAFAIVPAPYNIGLLFLNGLSLGMIWGIVFSYLEGRKFTEILGVALCSSFIVSSGAVKSVGLLVLNRFNVAEHWMPAITGAFFLIPFGLFAFFLNRIPKPSLADMDLRSERLPMSPKKRAKLVGELWLPLLIWVVFYIFLTALRDFRDNFSREIWDAIGYDGHISVYAWAEIPVALLVLVLLGALGFVKKNKKAFFYYHYLLILGNMVMCVANLLYQFQHISALLWMVLIGFGLYLCYVPFNGIFFDRMIAALHLKGNAGFLIYIADSFGYLGSIVVLIYKNFGQGERSWLGFFINGTYLVAFLGLAATTLSLCFFKSKLKSNSATEPKLNIV